MMETKGRVLVTGADGFIGSHLVERLVRDGYEVRAFVQYNSFNAWGWLDRCAPDVAGHFEVLSGDVRDAACIDTAVASSTTVFHLAALIAIPFSYQATQAYISTNITGTHNVLQAARRHGVARTVCTSTSEVYGSAQFVPITEAHPLNAQSPYAATKIAADQLALSFHHSFGLPVVVLRPFNTYGPRQSARAVIPTIIGQIAAGQREIKLGALGPTRDFTYVEDTARGFVAAAACEPAVGRVVNIGSGFEISIGDTAAVIAEAMDVDIRIVQDDARIRPESSEVDRLYAGIGLAQELFDWAPECSGRSGFVAGVARTAAWFGDPANLSSYKTDRYNV